MNKRIEYYIIESAPISISYDEKGSCTSLNHMYNPPFKIRRFPNTNNGSRVSKEEFYEAVKWHKYDRDIRRLEKQKSLSTEEKVHIIDLKILKIQLQINGLLSLEEKLIPHNQIKRLKNKIELLNQEKNKLLKNNEEIR
jgi:uncharacterized protein YbcC (UPF0753/DUF2309 family)